MQTPFIFALIYFIRQINHNLAVCIKEFTNTCKLNSLKESFKAQTCYNNAL